MKNVILCSVLTLLTGQSFCQQTELKTTLTQDEYFLKKKAKFKDNGQVFKINLTPQEYITKSKSQKIVGLLFLAAGATTLTILSFGKTNFKVLGPLAVSGSLITLASFSLFVASDINAKKAIYASSLSLKLEQNQVEQISQSGFGSTPTISLKLNL